LLNRRAKEKSKNLKEEIIPELLKIVSGGFQMKKVFLLLTTIIFVISMLFMGVGCKEAAEEAVPAEEEVAGEVTAEEEVPAEEVKRFEGTTITVVYMSGGYVDAANAIKDEFKELTGIEVQVVDYPWEGLHEKVLTELIAGTGNFDMIPIAGQWMGELAPYLEDIEPYIESQDVISDFQQSSYDVYNFSNVQYGFPYQTTVYSIVYRTDLFEEAGIEPNVNWTWDEYVEVAKKLTKDGMYGTALAGVKHQQNVYFINRYWGLGGKTTDPDWNVTMDNDITIAALKNLQETYKYSSPKASGGDISEQANVFSAGTEAAMYEGWPSIIWSSLDDPEASNVVGKWDILPLPGDGPIYGSLWGIGISKDSKNKEATYEWIKFYTSKDNQVMFWKDFGMVPVRTSVWEDPDILQDYSFFANYSLGQDRARPNWRITAANEGWEGILNDEVSKFNEGSQTAEETAKNIQEQWTTLLENKPAPEGCKNNE